MNKTMTYAQALEIAIASIDNADAKERLEALKAQLAKRNTAKSGKTKTQVANDGLKETIVASLAFGEKYTITDIMKLNDAFAEMSNQKMSALVRQLVLDGTLVREEIKRKAYFALNEEA